MPAWRGSATRRRDVSRSSPMPLQDVTDRSWSCARRRPRRSRDRRGTSIAGTRLDEERYGPFFDLVAGLGLPVLVHPAFNDQHPALDPWYLQNAIGNPLETTITVERLICAAYSAGSPPRGRARSRRRVHPLPARPPAARDRGATRITGPDDAHRGGARPVTRDRAHGPAALRFLVDRVPAGHVLLGTDMPYDMGVELPRSASPRRSRRRGPRGRRGEPHAALPER